MFYILTMKFIMFFILYFQDLMSYLSKNKAKNNADPY